MLYVAPYPNPSTLNSLAALHAARVHLLQVSCVCHPCLAGAPPPLTLLARVLRVRIPHSPAPVASARSARPAALLPGPHLGRPARSPRSSPARRRTPGHRSSAGARGRRRSGHGRGSSGPARHSPVQATACAAGLPPGTSWPLRPGRAPGAGSPPLRSWPSQGSGSGPDANRNRP